jgi:hypothetical protein
MALFFQKSVIMSTDALAREIAALVSERNLGPATLIAQGMTLADLGSGAASIPFDEPALMLRIAHHLRCEVWFLYRTANVPLPRELVDSLTKKRRLADAAAVRAKAASQARRKARRMKACPSCSLLKPRDAFRSGFASCKACSQKEVKSFSGAVKILEQVKPWRKST